VSAPFILVNPIGWRFEGFAALANRYAPEGAVTDFLDRCARGERMLGEGLPGIVVREYPDLVMYPEPSLAEDTQGLFRWLGLVPRRAPLVRLAVQVARDRWEARLPPAATDSVDPSTGLCACGCGMAPL
jgi:hypothetical protein